jgi:hypothetical protein
MTKLPLYSNAPFSLSGSGNKSTERKGANCVEINLNTLTNQGTCVQILQIREHLFVMCIKSKNIYAVRNLKYF